MNQWNNGWMSLGNNETTKQRINESRNQWINDSLNQWTYRSWPGPSAIHFINAQVMAALMLRAESMPTPVLQEKHKLVHWFTDSLRHWLINSLPRCLILLIHWFDGRFIESLVHWFTDSVIHWSIDSLIYCFFALLRTPQYFAFFCWNRALATVSCAFWSTSTPPAPRKHRPYFHFATPGAAIPVETQGFAPKSVFTPEFTHTRTLLLDAEVDMMVWMLTMTIVRNSEVC